MDKNLSTVVENEDIVKLDSKVKKDLIKSKSLNLFQTLIPIFYLL